MICEHGWTSAIDCDTCTRRRVAPNTAALEARIEDLESAILAAKTLLQPTTDATEDVWQILDSAYHRKSTR